LRKKYVKPFSQQAVSDRIINSPKQWVEGLEIEACGGAVEKKILRLV
jgi:hypothetical protein